MLTMTRTKTLVAEIGDEAVVIVDEGEIQENNNAEEGQPEQIEGNELNERPPDWFVAYIK